MNFHWGGWGGGMLHMPNMMFCLPTYLHMPSRKSEMTLKLRRTVQMDHILNKVRNFRDIPRREKTFLMTSLSKATCYWLHLRFNEIL